MMVTRRTRNYKEKKPMTTFGQFILPLTLIMAIALLFFSVKLFFFDSKDVPFYQEVKTKVETEKELQDEVKTSELKIVQPVEISDIEETEIPMPIAKPMSENNNISAAQPVKSKNVNTNETTKSNLVVKEPVKKESLKKVTDNGNILRWDVQIGAFSNKDYATDLIKNTRDKGYEVYISEIIRDGAPFYRVRVKNPKTSREDALSLSNKLQQQEYPTFLVEILK